MRGIKTWMILFVMGAVSTVIGGDVLSSLPSDIKMVGRLDVSQVREHPVVKKMKATHQDKVSQMEDRLLGETGVNVNDIDVVWAAAVREKQGLLVFEGNFDVPGIISTVTPKQDCQVIDATNCDFAVLVPDKRFGGDKKNLAVVLDPKTIAVGDPKLVRSLVENYTSGASKSVAMDDAMFLSGHALAARLISMPDLGRRGGNPILKALKSGEVTIDVGENLTIDASAKAASEQQAGAMEQMIRGMLTLQQGSVGFDETQRVFRDRLMNNMELSRDGDTINIHSSAALKMPVLK